MANYSLTNFLDLPSSTDIKLRIREKDGKIKYTIDPDVAYFFTKLNTVIIKKKDLSNDITLDFATSDLATKALTKLNTAKKNILNNLIPSAPSSGWTIYSEPTSTEPSVEIVPLEVPSSDIISQTPNYSLNNFVDYPSEKDTMLKIREKNGKLKYTVDPNVAYFYTKSNFIIIKIENLNNIILDFSNVDESIKSLSKLNEYKKIILRTGASTIYDNIILSTEQRKLAYFHALGRVMTENITQEVYNSNYKSSHNVRLNEIWSDIIYTAVTFTDAYNQSQYGTNPNPSVTFYSAVTLTEIPNSNGMSYYFSSGGTFIRPWISPVDVPNEITNLPSYGFEIKLYTSNNTLINKTDGVWSVDYYAGIIHFSQSKRPIDLGWGTPKCSFFQYTGSYGASGDAHLSNVNTNMEANNTDSGNTLACNIDILLKNKNNSSIMVFVNGIQVNVGNLVTDDCYFSGDLGVTPRVPGYERIHDKLYWNYVDGLPISGYNLNTVDRITFTYLYS